MVMQRMYLPEHPDVMAWEAFKKTEDGERVLRIFSGHEHWLREVFVAGHKAGGFRVIEADDFDRPVDGEPWKERAAAFFSQARTDLGLADLGSTPKPARVEISEEPKP